MKRPARWILGTASLVLFVGALGLAVALGPREARILLVAFGVLAVAAAVQSVTSEPRDLVPALVLALPPVIALVAEGSPTWLVGPLAILLFLAGQLNALSWECRGPLPMSAVQRRHLSESLALALLAIGGILAVEAVVSGSISGGRVAVALAALALAGLGLVTFHAGEGVDPDPAGPDA